MKNEAPLNKSKIIELAKEAELIYNLDVVPEGIYHWHRKKIYKFANLLWGEFAKKREESVKDEIR